MVEKRELKAVERAANINRNLMSDRRLYPQNAISIFMQVTLAVLYLYLLFAGYMMMGEIGLVVVSSLFLTALLSPVIYRAAARFMEKGKAHNSQVLADDDEDRGRVDTNLQHFLVRKTVKSNKG